MERNLDVRTGESVAIQYELAGLGSRFLAVGLDFLIQVGVTLLIVLILGAAMSLLHLSATQGRSKFFIAVAEGAGIFAIFVLYFGYFIVFELWWSGRTPGKRALGLRVVRDGGFPLDLGAATIRNMVRVLEFSVGLYLLALISALLSKQNKRLGDFAAATIVIRDGAMDEIADIAAFVERDRPSDDGLTLAERELVERYVARREQLDERARRRLAGSLAERIRPYLGASFDHLGDDELLEHIGRATARTR